MKASALWKTLTKTERRAWSAWAKDNKVLLDDGSVRRVSGRKAMTMVLRNRALAGEAANPAVLPEATTWLDGALSLRDAGPFTVNTGYVGFRVEEELTSETKWFVWATPPVNESQLKPLRLLRLVACLTLGSYDADEIIAGFGPDYQSVCGPWDGPGEEGEWPVDTFIWFRLHHYANGQLSPGVVLKGRIQIEL